MTTLAWGLLAVAAGAAVIDWAALAAGCLRVERIAKPAVLLALIGVALAAQGADPAARPWLLLALIASLAGDVLLLPPGRFVAGLVAFLVAQVAYLAAFVGRPGSVEGLGLGLLLAADLAVLVGRRILAGAARHGLAPPVAGYLAAICAMAVAATRTGSPVAALGAWSFVASDSVLGWDRFAAAPPSDERHAVIRRLAIMVPYHLGQAALVLALVA